jgi:hypothetical protein
MPDNAISDRDELDLLLDSALVAYVDSDPSPNLRSRVLSATTQRRGSEFPTGWAMWAAPALAALLLITILLIHHRTAVVPSPPVAHQSAPHGPELATSASKAPNANQAMAATSPLRLSQPRPIRTAHTVTLSQPTLPRQEVFPTPAPLSPEEQALVAEVNRNPERVSRQVEPSAARSDEEPIEPLRVAAIHIPPLNPPDGGTN